MCIYTEKWMPPLLMCSVATRWTVAEPWLLDVDEMLVAEYQIVTSEGAACLGLWVWRTELMAFFFKKKESNLFSNEHYVRGAGSIDSLIKWLFI